MAGEITRRWAIDLCKQFFGLTNDDEVAVRGDAGRSYMQQLWDTNPEQFYEHPLQLLRQEWFHAAHQQYAHGGFWTRLPRAAWVLDYGCGTGEVARLPWIQRDGRAVLVEVSERCLKYLNHKYLDCPKTRICALGGNWRDYAPYDAIVCTDVFEHLPNPLEVQAQLWEVLKSGGHALLKFESVYPHPGHLADSIAQIRPWMHWMNTHSDLIEIETYAWARKPL